MKIKKEYIVAALIVFGLCFMFMLGRWTKPKQNTSILEKLQPARDSIIALHKENEYIQKDIQSLERTIRQYEEKDSLLKAKYSSDQKYNIASII